MKSTAISKESVRKATGKSREEWFNYLDEINANQMPHKEIAKLLAEKDGVSDWWAQSITVEYERKMGRREVGQTSAGDFQAAVSKTLLGSMDWVFHKWKDFARGMDQLNGIAFEGPPQCSKTENWRYWRVSLQNGNRVSIMVSQKDEDRSQLSVTHEKLLDAKAVETWKGYWRDVFQKFHKHYQESSTEE